LGLGLQIAHYLVSQSAYYLLTYLSRHKDYGTLKRDAEDRSSWQMSLS